MNSKAHGAELDSIAKKHNGVLRAKDVVDFARNPDTELHKKFEWDDTAAADKYRITQAQLIIRCHVVVIENEDKEIRVRAYQSIPSMRGDQEYRKTEDVLKNGEWRDEMLDAALKEMTSFKQKYEVLTELSGVWDEVEKLKVSRNGTGMP